MKFSRDSVRTGGVGDRETTELDRRSQDTTRLNGKVKEVDYKSKPPKYRVEFGDPKDEDDYILTDWLPAAGGRAQGDVDTHLLEVGERVTMHSEGGEFATGPIHPAGTYTDDDDDRRAGTDKAGVFRKKFKNGAEMSYDRETGDMVFKANGQEKQQSTGGDSGSGGSGASATTAEGGAGKKIAGSISLQIDDLSFMMKGGKLTLTAGGTTFEFGSDGFKQTGGKQEHDGHSVDKDHTHKNVQNGPGVSGPPV